MKFSEMNKDEKGGMCGLFFGALVGYRVIPALYIIANGEHDAYRKASEDLLSTLKHLGFGRIEWQEILDLIMAHKNWINYTFHDMLFYYHKVKYNTPDRKLSEEQGVCYLPAMAEIVNSPFLEWAPNTFDCGVKHPTILDIGCGYAPYARLFRRDNKGDLHYVCVDKRQEAMEYLEDPQHIPRATMFYKYGCNVSILFDKRPSHFTTISDTVNCVFFGNSLHCFEQPEKLLQEVAKLPQVTKIMVLEFSPQSALGLFFDFHMYMHAGTGTVDLPFMKGWVRRASHPTHQHKMVSYTKQ